MRTLNVTFTDEEFEQIKEVMEYSDYKNWHDFILLRVSAIKHKKVKK